MAPEDAKQHASRYKHTGRGFVRGVRNMLKCILNVLTGAGAWRGAFLAATLATSGLGAPVAVQAANTLNFEDPGVQKALIAARAVLDERIVRNDEFVTYYASAHDCPGALAAAKNPFDRPAFAKKWRPKLAEDGRQASAWLVGQEIELRKRINVQDYDIDIQAFPIRGQFPAEFHAGVINLLTECKEDAYHSVLSYLGSVPLGKTGNITVKPYEGRALDVVPVNPERARAVYEQMANQQTELAVRMRVERLHATDQGIVLEGPMLRGELWLREGPVLAAFAPRALALSSAMGGNFVDLRRDATAVAHHLLRLKPEFLNDPGVLWREAFLSEPAEAKEACKSEFDRAPYIARFQKTLSAKIKALRPLKGRLVLVPGRGELGEYDTAKGGFPVTSGGFRESTGFNYGGSSACPAGATGSGSASAKWTGRIALRYAPTRGGRVAFIPMGEEKARRVVEKFTGPRRVRLMGLLKVENEAVTDANTLTVSGPIVELRVVDRYGGRLLHRLR